MVKIMIDAMGGDNAPDAIVKGSIDAINDYPNIEVTLFGDEEKIKNCLKNESYDVARMHVVHAPDVVQNEEAPVQAVRRKKNASVVMALTALGNGEGDGFVGAGSTGAVLAGATLLVKRLPDVQRPALAPLLPTITGKNVLLIDCGANIDCKPDWLAQFGVMGSVYMNKVRRVREPRVAILNNGVEEHKGNALVQQAYELLKQMPIHFVGNVEAREILSGEVDVVVADGFVGNVALKSIEGTASMMSKLLKKTIMGSTRSKIGGLFLKPAMAEFKYQMDYTEHGGAPLLGVNKAVVKAHGSSNARAFYHAIRQCEEMVNGEVPQLIGSEIAAQPALASAEE